MSSTFSLEHALKAVAEDGFYYVHDSTIGQRILEAEQKGVGFSTSSEDGWNFCKVNVLGDKRIAAVIESSLGQCGLGYYRRHAEDRERIYQIRKGGLEADILTVHLLSKESQLVYYPHSHTIRLSSVRASNRMFEIPLAALTRQGIKGKEILFVEGGFAILDARLGFEMKVGNPITCGFAVEEQLKKWPKLARPRSAESVQMPPDLERGKISVLFEDYDNSKSAKGGTG